LAMDTELHTSIPSPRKAASYYPFLSMR
jgi:hypothetical protein